MSLEMPPEMRKTRLRIATKFLSGTGIEIGALHAPLDVPPHVNIKYVDRLDVDGLLNQYPEMSNSKLVDVDILDDGEKLKNIANNSLDFIIANHFLEHCQNPIEAVKNHLLRLKRKGVLYYAIPIKWKTFDIDRPLTEFDHLMNDYLHGPTSSYEQHMREWSSLVNKTPIEKQKDEVSGLMAMNYSIHFHVWDDISFRDFLYKINDFFGHSFEIEEFTVNQIEVIVILRKIRDPRPLLNNLNEDRKEDDILGHLDKPVNFEKIGNVLEISGWSFSNFNRELTIGVFIDDTLVGKTNAILERPDVANYFSSENVLKCGFFYRTDIQNLDNGIHKLQIISRSDDKTSKIIGDISFVKISEDEQKKMAPSN